MGRSSAARALEYNLQELGVAGRDGEFARTLVETTLANLETIDDLIQRHATHWTVERMARTDRNILRMALCEILYLEDVPDSVAVNEAVELAKLYGDADSGKFVNGVLGNIVRSRQGADGAAGEPSP